MRGPLASALPTILFLAMGAGFASAASTAPADSVGDLPPRAGVFGTRDMAKAVIASGGVAVLALLDGNISHGAPMWKSSFARGLSSGSEKLGNPLYIAPVLGLTWLAGRATGHPGVSASALRIAGGIGASCAVSSTMKLVAGRSRPYESPGDPDQFRAFSGHNAFPSGHTTVAFALASGIDHETDARWVPWVVYPVAGMVGWSRLRDNRHWASDVLAGALVGIWTTHKFQVMARRGEQPASLEVGIVPAPDSPGVGATLHF